MEAVRREERQEAKRRSQALTTTKLNEAKLPPIL